jgi:hypothetical protein
MNKLACSAGCVAANEAACLAILADCLSFLAFSIDVLICWLAMLVMLAGFD